MMGQLSRKRRILVLLGLLVLAVSGVLALPPIAQDPAYHLFADSRSFFGIPNFNDVVSNIGFTLVGVLGLLLVIGEGSRMLFAESVDARPYRIFFIAVALVGVGSAYYHWAPSNERLFWDRLPMAIAFMAITSATVADRIDARAGNGWLLWLLLALGAASLIYWYWTESLGRGDLRLYALVQFYPMLAIPIMLVCFRSRCTHVQAYWWLLLLYIIAKLFEHFDGEVYNVLGFISGHLLKHLTAALGMYVLLVFYQKRD